MDFKLRRLKWQHENIERAVRRVLLFAFRKPMEITNMRLIYKRTGEEVKIGDPVYDVEGRLQKIFSFREPSKSEYPGKILVRNLSIGMPGFSGVKECDVSFVGAEWIER